MLLTRNGWYINFHTERRGRVGFNIQRHSGAPWMILDLGLFTIAGGLWPR